MKLCKKHAKGQAVVRTTCTHENSCHFCGKRAVCSAAPLVPARFINWYENVLSQDEMNKIAEQEPIP